MMNDITYDLKQVEVRLYLKDIGAVYSKQQIDEPVKAVDLIADTLKDLDRETAIVLNMNSNGVPINFNTVSIGSLNESIVPIQNVFKSSILCNSNYILLLHNHPSGNLEPSNKDIEITKKLVAAGNLLNIKLLDHIIVSYNGYKSLKSDMPYLFDKQTTEDIDFTLKSLYENNFNIKSKGNEL